MTQSNVQQNVVSRHVSNLITQKKPLNGHFFQTLARPPDKTISGSLIACLHGPDKKKNAISDESIFL